MSLGHGWTLYAAGEHVRCPDPGCHRGHDMVGAGTVVAVRIKNGHKDIPPAPILDRKCRGCGQNLDIHPMRAVR